MAKNNVLVLNLDYSPISVCSVERAFLLIFLGKAEPLANYESQSLRSVSQKFNAPAVIKIRRYVNIPYKGVMLSRQNIFKRDNQTCQYCGSKKDLTLDHVIPRSKGGKSTWNNLVTACKKCNSLKGDMLLEESPVKLKTLPYKPGYGVFLQDFSGQSNKEWEPFLRRKSKA
ncbi:MAG: HNH endonuclease [Cyclobacteriaceae bacterium]|nr:HNH endonuclease [Cyclobacteriaceae bacterium]MCH8515716.1 HNH endonuclease [Cyclobacteriaceae bacterium]